MGVNYRSIVQVDPVASFRTVVIIIFSVLFKRWDFSAMLRHTSLESWRPVLTVLISSLGVFHDLGSGGDKLLVLWVNLIDYSSDPDGGAVGSSASFLDVLLHFSHLLGGLAIRLTDSSSSLRYLQSRVLVVTAVTIHLGVTLSDRWQFYFLSHFDDVGPFPASFSSLTTSTVSAKFVTVSLFTFFLLFGAHGATFARRLTGVSVPVEAWVVRMVMKIVEKWGNFWIINWFYRFFVVIICLGEDVAELAELLRHVNRFQ